MNPEVFLTRRSAALVLLGAASGTAAVLRLRSPAALPGQGPEPDAFDETYQGRRISGIRLPDSAAADGSSWQVSIDGRPLHLMRRADGSYLSMVDHYDSCDGPLAAARGAVAALGDQGLRNHESRPGTVRDRKV